MAMVTDAKPSGRAVCMARVARLDEESARQAREFFLDESILHSISSRNEAATAAGSNSSSDKEDSANIAQARYGRIRGTGRCQVEE